MNLRERLLCKELWLALAGLIIPIFSAGLFSNESIVMIFALLFGCGSAYSYVICEACKDIKKMQCFLEKDLPINFNKGEWKW